MMRTSFSMIFLNSVIFSVLCCGIGNAQSVLGNINCGGNQATCFQQSSGEAGAVRCTCTADCQGRGCITPSVGATRAVQWSGCLFSLQGTARGGTTVGLGALESAVFASTEVSGFAIGIRSSRQVVDCFYGTIVDETPIAAFC
jgi:hypothetical protein